MAAGSTTFVIATYKRVNALRCTLRSLVLQEEQNWDAIVVGDCCGPQTADMIRTLNEPRIRYYNLPRRCGEQSGPNTFGLHLAKGEFVSFLNHDDLLLRDHLSSCLSTMRRRRLDFLLGRFANITSLAMCDDGRAIPQASRFLPDPADLNYLIHPDPYLFDPSSFWLIRTSYARKVGAWRPVRTIYRTPLRDWIMRAWRRRGRFGFGDAVTGMRFWTQNRHKNQPLYACETPEHDAMLKLLESEPSDVIRSLLTKQVAEAARSGGERPFAPPHMPAWKRTWHSALYLALGFDSAVRGSGESASHNGRLMQQLAAKRTGEPLPVEWDVHSILGRAEDFRII